MMLDFELHRCTRQCCETEAILQPGDEFYSALVVQGAQVIRRDYAAAAWKGPPEGTLGWWKAQVPDIQSRRMFWAPNDVMAHYFEQLYEQADAPQDLCYVLTLLMIRRRVVRLEDTERDDDGHETFVLYCPRNEREYRVAVVTPTPERIGEIQQHLGALLFGGNTSSEAATKSESRRDA
jgi:hypothetical protein